ncbi:hypothetical protein E2C01_061028 [Portunus trituberculatus]|uniref:Uncharacterized protein n=1 Tax=Portunus trituberculatus TaxID=210409 RepID=A0A5B7H9N3_PORTR|nr:hypothetical protein [Portunus trituberculatus]
MGVGQAGVRGGRSGRKQDKEAWRSTGRGPVWEECSVTPPVHLSLLASCADQPLAPFLAAQCPPYTVCLSSDTTLAHDSHFPRAAFLFYVKYGVYSQDTAWTY